MSESSSSTTSNISGTVVVGAGSSLSGATVQSGGVLSAYYGGTISDTRIMSGGTVYLLSANAVGYNDQAEQNGGIVVSMFGKEIASAGTARNVTVSSRGVLQVVANGVVSGASVRYGGSVSVQGGTLVDGDINYGGLVDVGGYGSGAVVSNLLVSNGFNGGGSAFIRPGGTSVSGHVVGFGTMIVGSSGVSGGTSYADTVSGGGSLVVASGGITISSVVGSGGNQKVLIGGSASSAVVSAGGVLSSYYGGKISDTRIMSGGIVYLTSANAVGYNDQAEQSGGILVSMYAKEIASAGTVRNVLVSSAGTLQVIADGVVDNAVIAYQGYAQVASGTMSGATSYYQARIDVGGAGGNAVVSNMILSYGIGGGGSAYILSGGTSISGSVRWGSVMYVSASGATSLDDTIDPGGKIVAARGGVVSNVVVSGGTVDNAMRNGVAEASIGGTIVHAIVSSGGSLWAHTDALTASSGAIGLISGATVYGGGQITIGDNPVNSLGKGAGSNNVLLSGAVEVVSRGSVETGGTIGSGATLVLNDVNGLVSGRLEPHGSLILNYVSGYIKSANITSDGLLTVYPTYSSPQVIQLAGKYDVNQFTYDKFGITLLCFLPGTLLRTPSGERKVEEIITGDIVSTWDWKRKQETVKRVKWVGSQKKIVDNRLPDDESGYPVRILKDAIAEGVPKNDLLVTPEHCLFFNESFVPARMLVNGNNIFYDKTINEYIAYHVETEEHSVLWAENMLSESYLDTGNRRSFVQHGSVMRLGEDAACSWDRDAAAPLNTSRDNVETIYNEILLRSGMQRTKIETIENTDICILTDKGEVIHPARTQKGFVVFQLNSCCEYISIVSNASRPCDIIGPFVDDRRNLGVLVGKIVTYSQDYMTTLDSHLSAESLPGWHALEEESCRWTDGLAHLPLGENIHTQQCIIAIEVMAGGPYLSRADVRSEIKNREAIS